MKTKNIAVLGSTGSIGTQTLEVIRNNDDMRVVSLAAGSNITLLQKQIEEFSPKLVCVFDKKKAEKSKEPGDRNSNRYGRTYSLCHDR